MSQLPKPPQTRTLGASGIHVSTLAWGMWRFKGNDLKAARAKVDAAFDAGITLFDTADIYGFGEDGFGAAETLLGQLFAEDKSLRNRMVLASKGGIIPPTPYDSSPAYLESAIDASLKRLQTNRIDLWQIHRPDILTHPHDIARALEKAHALGKIVSIGVSNYTPAQTDALRLALPRDLKLVSIQPEFSALHLEPIENGLFDAAVTHNYAVLAWSPLGGGRIAEPSTDRERAVAAALDAVAQAQGVSRTAAALSWIMAHPAAPIPIIGSQNPDRIRESADALNVEWTRTNWYNVLVAARGEPLP
jgi:predicted oxidoreductase